MGLADDFLVAHKGTATGRTLSLVDCLAGCDTDHFARNEVSVAR
jgi:hypothetical protein